MAVEIESPSNATRDARWHIALASAAFPLYSADVVCRLGDKARINIFRRQTQILAAHEDGHIAESNDLLCLAAEQ